MPLTSELLPAPLTPVTAVKTPTGNRTSTFLRLCSRAPLTVDPRGRAAPLRGHLDSTLAREILAREAGARLDRVGRPVVDDLAALRAGARPEVDHVIGGADRLLVVLDDDDAVAEIAQAPEGGDEARVVASVQADARLVEHVHHAGQLAPELAREAYALRLAAAQRRPGPLERQVVEADVDQEAQAALDLAERALADRARRRSERQPRDVGRGLRDRHRRHLGDALAGHAHGEALGAQALAAAPVARPLPHEPPVLLAHRLRRRLPEAPLERRNHARVLHRPRAVVLASLLAPLDADAGAVGAVQHQVALGLGQLAPRRVEIDLEGAGHPLDDARRPPFAALHRARPVGDGALADRLLAVGHEELRVDLVASSESVARRAHPERRVEREALRRQLGGRHAAARARRAVPSLARRRGPSRGARRVPRGGRASTPSATRARSAARTTTRSTTRPTSCFFFLSSAGTASSAYVSPSTTTLAKPRARRSSKISRNSPLRWTTSGATSSIFVPSGRASTSRVTACGALGGDLLSARGAMLLTHLGEEDAQVVVDLGDRPDGRPRVR